MFADLGIDDDDDDSDDDFAVPEFVEVMAPKLKLMSQPYVIFH